MFRKTLFVLAAAMASPAAALDCDAAYTQIEINACAEQMYRLADEDLNHAYGLARDAAKRIDSFKIARQPNAETLLRDAQRAWIPFRDAACRVESMSAAGGSMQSALLFSCLERLTRTRTEDLRFFAEVN